MTHQVWYFYFFIRTLFGVRLFYKHRCFLWCEYCVRAPLRGRVFQHMDIFLFNYVPRFRHNESGFSQISIFCGCVKSHGRVWKNESHGVILMVFVGRKPSAWKRQIYAFSSALPTSLFQPLLRQRSPRHLYMSLWQFFATQKPRHISWRLSHSNSQLFYCSMSLGYFFWRETKHDQFAEFLPNAHHWSFEFSL